MGGSEEGMGEGEGVEIRFYCELPTYLTLVMKSRHNDRKEDRKG
jgi:hypothetical protein